MRVRWLGSLLFFGAIIITGLRVHRYFFDRNKPTITLHGLESHCYYTGEMQCTVASSKDGQISIWLDEQPLLSQFQISMDDHGHNFAIPTKTLSNGKHHLRIAMTDRTYRRNSASLERTFYVDNVSLQAALLKIDDEYKVFQGRTLHVQFQVNKEIKEAKIKVLSHMYDCFPESNSSSIYEAFIPIACEENPSEYLFSIDITDKVGSSIRLDHKFQVVMFPFKKVHLAIADQKIEDEKEQGKPSCEFKEMIQVLANNSPKKKLWKGRFCTPIEIQRVSTEFGTIRTTPHKGRYAHCALDVLNVPKSVVWATQDGVVVMKDRYAESGNTVIIDHGLGVLSMFFHLDRFADIDVGQIVAKGNPIGTIGKTGYASGYHLHWEMRVDNVPVDPIQWTKTIF